jgi:hypothetical protein
MMMIYEKLGLTLAAIGLATQARLKAKLREIE